MEFALIDCHPVQVILLTGLLLACVVLAWEVGRQFYRTLKGR